ncbi:MAG: HAD hydrolase family protein [Candidatus Pacearchaeota archaeon]
MKKNLTIKEHEGYCQQILKKVKSTIKAFVMDQDGTIKGGDDKKYQEPDVVSKLLQKIIQKSKYPIIITASGVTALKSLEDLVKFYQNCKIEIPIFVSIGNGNALYKFDKLGKTEIYSNKLSTHEIKNIIDLCKKIYSSLNIKEEEIQKKGIENFKRFINMNWTGYIPKDYFDIFKEYDGKCFCEEVKLTVVFPSWNEEKQRWLVKNIQNSIDSKFGKNKFLVSRGDSVYMHLTKTFSIDPKLYTLQYIMKDLRLEENEVAVFGDLPFDNDKGILIDSKLPYTFTNIFIEKDNLEDPPFILPGSSESQVGSVHKAIDYLLS